MAADIASGIGTSRSDAFLTTVSYLKMKICGSQLAISHQRNAEGSAILQAVAPRRNVP